MSPKIGILGGTGQIARSVCPHLTEFSEVLLYSRTPPDALPKGAPNIQHFPLEQFGVEQVDILVNAIGVGDPSGIRSEGRHIRETTRHFDRLAMEFLGKTVDSYLFLSSVSVYGAAPIFPVRPNSLLDFNRPLRSDYGEAKFDAEIGHAQHGGPIVDIRIFGFVSSIIPLHGGFLVGQIFEKAISGKPFFPLGPDFVRDYIGPAYLANLIKSATSCTPANQRVDATSRRPTSRNRILREMESVYGLQVIWNSAEDEKLAEDIPMASTMSHPWSPADRPSSLEAVMSAAAEIFGRP